MKLTISEAAAGGDITVCMFIYRTSKQKSVIEVIRTFVTEGQHWVCKAFIFIHLYVQTFEHVLISHRKRALRSKFNSTDYAACNLDDSSDITDSD